jgi:hypothetical protein
MEISELESQGYYQGRRLSTVEETLIVQVGGEGEHRCLVGATRTSSGNFVVRVPTRRGQ